MILDYFNPGFKQNCHDSRNVEIGHELKTHQSVSGRSGELGLLSSRPLLVPLGQLPEEAAKPSVRRLLWRGTLLGLQITKGYSSLLV